MPTKTVYKCGEVVFPAGIDKENPQRGCVLIINNKPHQMLHEQEADIKSGQHLMTACVLDEDTTINSLSILCKGSAPVSSGEVSVTLLSEDENTVIACKQISSMKRKIVFGCSEIRTRRANAGPIRIKIESVCTPEDSTCCQEMPKLDLINQINNVCIVDPCGTTMPTIIKFATSRNTSVRLLVTHNSTGAVLLDTGVVNTRYSLGNYVTQNTEGVYIFTNESGSEYPLLKKPDQYFVSDPKVDMQQLPDSPMGVWYFYLDICSTSISTSISEETNTVGDAEKDSFDRHREFLKIHPVIYASN